MSIIESVAIAIGLAMDAFAVSICKGLSMKKMDWKKAIIIGSYFGFFQALMPIIGYYLGISSQKFVTEIDHWITFCLLAFIGINMIKEAFSKKEERITDSVDVKTMVMLSVATSIDALAVGITIAFINSNIFSAAFIIGVITFAVSIVGVKIGKKFGNRYERKAEVFGGILLILIGLHILLEHLGII